MLGKKTEPDPDNITVITIDTHVIHITITTDVIWSTSITTITTIIDVIHIIGITTSLAYLESRAFSYLSPSLSISPASKAVNKARQFSRLDTVGSSLYWA